MLDFLTAIDGGGASGGVPVVEVIGVIILVLALVLAAALAVLVTRWALHMND